MIAQSLVRPTARFTQLGRLSSRSSAALVCCASLRSHGQRHSFASLRFDVGSLFGRGKSPGIQKNHLWHTWSNGELVNRPLVPGEECEVSVVLLGWLGAEQKHLRRYAEWYNSRGIHAITFVMPMGDLLNLSAMDRAQQHVDSLYAEITRWLSRGGARERSLLFHTFSNTGWFVYGALLEKFEQEQEAKLVSRIKGCVVDSGPAAELSSQVWASGFATAFLQKRSVATQPLAVQLEPSMSETLLLGSLERFFAMLFSIPAVKQRLLGVIGILSSKQPACPQLYLYSSADRVIPPSYVESFIALQKKAGYLVSSYDLRLSPHVDHFRNFPVLYCSLLDKFISECFRLSSPEIVRND